MSERYETKSYDGVDGMPIRRTWDSGVDRVETAGETSARLGTDAVLWAAEFTKLFAGKAVGIEGGVDHALMVGWFASAIESGRSAGQQVTVPGAEYRRFLGEPPCDDPACHCHGGTGGTP